jgi:hypothetical protein
VKGADEIFFWISGDIEKCSGDQVVLRRGGRKCFSDSIFKTTYSGTLVILFFSISFSSPHMVGKESSVIAGWCYNDAFWEGR